MTMASITNGYVYKLLMEKFYEKWDVRYKHVCMQISAALDLKRKENLSVTEVYRSVRKYCFAVRRRWEECHRREDKFLQKYGEWLIKKCNIIVPNITSGRETTRRGGRPKKDINACKPRSKRRKTMKLRETATTSELVSATVTSLRTSGQSEEATLMNEVLCSTPKRAHKIAVAWKSSQCDNIVQPYSANEALALMLDINLTKKSYLKLRNEAKKRNCKLYPSYRSVSEAKTLCYPPPEKISVTERNSTIDMQALLDHTANRIIELQSDVVDTLPSKRRRNLYLFTKWGFDGSSGHSMFKQSSEDAELKDCNLFMTCLVPLLLYSAEFGNANKKVIWRNPRPSSTRFCRPVKLEFIKESPNVILKEGDQMKKLISRLEPTKISYGEETIFIEHKMCLTMVDGKVVNALTDTSSAQKCYVCGVLPKDVNNIDEVQNREVNEDVFEYGLSTLHAYIRFLEWILHVAYRLNVKTWKVKKVIRKEVELRKRDIQEKLRREIGILVDMVKPGFGCTNDGNTARRFFNNSVLSASITGVDKTLISRCNIVLRTLSCGYEVNPQAFHQYVMDTAKLYVGLYSWYPMPVSVHKILFHGAQIISVALLPIGMLSEESLEARNKDFRRYRVHHCRKTSRTDTNLDLIHIMLTSSDPLISSLREVSPRKSGSLDHEMLSLLQTPENTCEKDSSDSEESSEVDCINNDDSSED